VPGHEGVGVVERVGPRVTAVAVGDRVAVPWLGYACGHCEYCVDGRETLCEAQVNTGYGVDGAHAEYVVANASHVVRVPDAVSSLPKDNIMRLPVFETVLGGISVIGSIVGTRVDLAEVFRLHAAGRTKVDVEVRKLDEINDAVEDVLAGRVTARVVLQP
jgi:D-arabinose 1-dehydrogenase-like Zn-dependent alcohol dehydrogenase